MNLILSITFAVALQLIAQIAGIIALAVILIGVLDNAIYQYFNERQIFAKVPVLEEWIHRIGNIAFYVYLITTFVYIFL